MASKLKQSRLFEVDPKPRKKREWRMHVIDGGHQGCKHPEVMCLFECHRCKSQSEWLIVENMKAARRGIPCPKCNCVSTATE